MATNDGIIFKDYPAEHASSVLLLVHGMGGHSGRWESCADYFVKRGVACAAIDLPGFGRSSAARGHVDSFTRYVEEVLAWRSLLAQRYPQKNFVLVGESMGALVACLVCLRQPDLFSGLVCLAPAFKTKVKVPLTQVFSAGVFSLVNPHAQFCLPFSAGMLTRDISYQERMGADQREQRCVTAGLLGSFVAMQKQLKRSIRRLAVPSLFVLAGSDVVVNNAAARQLFASITCQDKKLIEHPHMFHALSIDVGKEKVFEDIVSWMKTHALYPRH